MNRLVAECVPVFPASEALVFAQDKPAMRRRLSELGVPMPCFTAVRTVDDVEAFVARVGGPVVRSWRWTAA